MLEIERENMTAEEYEQLSAMLDIEIDCNSREYRLFQLEYEEVETKELGLDNFDRVAFGGIVCGFLNGEFTMHHPDLDMVLAPCGGFVTYLRLGVQSEDKMKELLRDQTITANCNKMEARAVEVSFHKNSVPTIRYAVRDESQLLTYDIAACIGLHIEIHKCPVCGRYFPKNRYNQKYCNNECGQVGAKNASYSNRKNSETRRIRKAILDRIGHRCGTDSEEYWSFYQKDELKKRTLSPQEYLEWLREQDETSRRYKKNKK